MKITINVCFFLRKKDLTKKIFPFSCAAVVILLVSGYSGRAGVIGSHWLCFYLYVLCVCVCVFVFVCVRMFCVFLCLYHTYSGRAGVIGSHWLCL